jgi:hypothetical protein
MRLARLLRHVRRAVGSADWADDGPTTGGGSPGRRSRPPARLARWATRRAQRSARPRDARPPRPGRLCGTTPGCTLPTARRSGWPAMSTSSRSPTTSPFVRSSSGSSRWRRSSSLVRQEFGQDMRLEFWHPRAAIPFGQLWCPNPWIGIPGTALLAYGYLDLLRRSGFGGCRIRPGRPGRDKSAEVDNSIVRNDDGPDIAVARHDGDANATMWREIATQDPETTWKRSIADSAEHWALYRAKLR